MSTLRSALFIARRDLDHMLWRRETMLWMFVMPILFFYFIGTVTGGFGSPTGSEDRPDALAMRAPENAGFLLDELVARLEEQNFRVDRPETDEDWARYAPQLTVTPAPTEETTGHESLTALVLHKLVNFACAPPVVFPHLAPMLGGALVARLGECQNLPL